MILPVLIRGLIIGKSNTCNVLTVQSQGAVVLGSIGDLHGQNGGTVGGDGDGGILACVGHSGGDGGSSFPLGLRVGNGLEIGEKEVFVTVGAGDIDRFVEPINALLNEKIR